MNAFLERAGFFSVNVHAFVSSRKRDSAIIVEFSGSNSEEAGTAVLQKLRGVTDYLHDQNPQLGHVITADVTGFVVGDLNGDGLVDLLDLIQVISSWGPCMCLQDFNGDGSVDLNDIIVIISHWTLP